MRRNVLIIGLVCGILAASPPTWSQPGSPIRARQLWAIIVGVGSPLDPQARAQSSGEAVQQALTVLSWLNGTAGWSRSHLLVLTDLGGSDDPGSPRSPSPFITPSRKNLDWALQQWLPAHAQAGDLVVFYFAGQARAATGADPLAPPEYYLLPSDVLLNNLPGRGLPDRGWSLDRALDGTARQGKYQIVCWLGTTLQPLQAPGAGPGRPLDLARLNRDWIRRVARWPGVTAWLAADHPPAKPSTDPAVLFTGAVLEAQGTKDSKQNLAASLQTLHGVSKLKVEGFQAIGGVPPDLTLWADQLGPPLPTLRPEMVLQVGHADRVAEIVSTPDNRLVITASQDSTIRVWSPGQKSLLRVLTGHSVGATALALSHNGKWLVSGGGMGEVLVHDLADDFARRPIARQPHDPGVRVSQVVMLPDGTHFVTIDRNGEAFLWDLGHPALAPERWIEGVVCRKVAAGGRSPEGVVAALCDDGTVRLFAASGDGGGILGLPGCQPSAVSISPDGGLLGVGCEDGRVVVKDLKSGRQFDRKLADGPIEQLAFSARNYVAVGHARGVRLLELRPGPAAGAEAELIQSAAEKLAFSPDGGLLAACARNTGLLQAWKLDVGVRPQVVLEQSQAGVYSLAFSSDGRALITGTKLGSIKIWPLDNRHAPDGWTTPANRGKVQQIAASPGRRSLLLLNELRQASLWNLGERSCRRLPGSWTAGVFTGEDVLVLAGRVKAGQPGRLVRLDRRTMTPDGAFFARSSGTFQVPTDVSFETIALSADGTRIAASTSGSRLPLVCVWETSTGRLTHWISDSVLTHPASALSFSSDARWLVTAGDSKDAELWDLGRHAGAAAKPAVTFRDDASKDIKCVQLRPGPHRQMVSGHSDGRLLLWTWEEGETRLESPAQVLAERFFNGAVHAITFSPEGRYLAAAGVGTQIWLAEMEPRVRPIRDLGTPPHHFEQINALAFWPDWSATVRLALSRVLAPGFPAIAMPPRPPLLISGSDDTTLRFWDLPKRALLATFCAAATAGESPEPPKPAAASELDWVLYTPDGHFDASQEGRDLVQFRRGDSVRKLEQFDGTKLYSFDLTDSLHSGRPSEPAPLDQPPPVAIDPPLRDDPTQANTRLTVSLGSTDLQDVRVYHNGVPIPSGLEEAQPPLPDRFDVRVRLLPGSNRFYAMASREGAYDSRSQDVEIPYEGPIEPGRLHVIALGVGNYERERLSFAKRDAERLSQVLHARGLGPQEERGERLLLTDDQVNAKNVSRAFLTVARSVRNRPQDSVVLFIAGHTGVFDNQRFCLLLPHYPFPEEAPLMVAARSANPPVAAGAKVNPDDLLAVSSLTVKLMQMEALNRLVIVDACQAEAILLDPQVELIRKWMEIGSRKARTSYLMATRRGEPALEVEPLRHGLFTYTLLRGIREIAAREEQPEITRLKLRTDADYNGDGVITVAELDTYVKEVLPPISRLYPDLVQSRSAPADPRPARFEKLDQSVRLQTAAMSFPLIKLLGGAGAAP